MKINDFKNNLYSQFGEDGIIEKIFQLIEPKNKTCIEFGAWDGEYLSNTSALWKHYNWKAILIESDFSKFNLLKSKTNKNCVCINELVDCELNSLDLIIDKYKLNKDVDFLSIDIDGNDYYILESLVIRPKVICIEYNPTIPYWLDIKQKYNDVDQMGASPYALLKLAESIDYFLIAATDVNMFFVHNSYKKIFSRYEKTLSELICKDHYNIIVSKYNGKSIYKTPFVFGKRE